MDLQLYSVRDAMCEINCSDKTIRRYIKLGKLRATEIGKNRKMLFPRKQVIALKKARDNFHNIFIKGV